ncbi:MAG: hypothetical protein MHPSP_002140, partial [Paramarteilia canceri]
MSSQNQNKFDKSQILFPSSAGLIQEVGFSSPFKYQMFSNPGVWSVDYHPMNKDGAKLEAAKSLYSKKERPEISSKLKNLEHELDITNFLLKTDEKIIGQFPNRPLNRNEIKSFDYFDLIGERNNNHGRPCKYMYFDGKCEKPDCCYRHDFNSIICRFWMKGFCKNLNCKFLHPE